MESIFLVLVLNTVFENQRKSLIQHCERSELSSLKMPKMVNLANFGKPESCSQTVLPDKSILIVAKKSLKCRKWSIWRILAKKLTVKKYYQTSQF